MADISTGRQRGIVPFVDETTGRLPDQYLPQGVIDLQGDLEQAVTEASASATAASQSASQAQSNATAANSSAQAAAAAAESAQTATESAASSKDAAAQSASEASASAQAAEASKTSAASSASAAKASETNAAASATAAQQAVEGFGLEVGTTTTGEPGMDAAVSIAKQGTKYVADFTIPRGEKGDPGIQGPKGDPGDLTTVAHDATLTGAGTSGNPLGVNAYTILADNTDFNNVRTFGIYLKLWNRHAINTPITVDSTQYLLLVNKAGNKDADDTVQVIVPIGGVNGADKIYFRYYAMTTNWSDWKQLVTSNDLSNYVPLSTYRTLETKVQALETKTSYKQITNNGTDLHTLFGTSGSYIKAWGTTVVNAPNSTANGTDSKYIITVVNDGVEGYMRIDPMAGVVDSYYCRKTGDTIRPWYKITATKVSE